MHVLVIGAGPAGVVAALRAADLGARTTLVTDGEFGGMAANDGPLPVRTLAHAARLLRDARQLADYGIRVGEPVLDYPRLLERVGEVVGEARTHSILRPQLKAAGVAIHERVGRTRFVDPATVETGTGTRFTADRIIVCTGGSSRRLPLPGFELTATHSDAWALQAVPESMIVLGAGATGLQVASIFAAFGTQIQLFEPAPRILPTEDEEVSQCVARSLRERGIRVVEDFGAVERFEAVPGGVRMTYGRNGTSEVAEAALAVAAVGWVADTGDLDLAAAGIACDARGFVAVDESGRTSVPHIFAAGDVTGIAMLAPQAMQAGFAAASAALDRPADDLPRDLIPIGSFTDPEYAQVGLTTAAARERHDVVAATVPFDSLSRAIIDGRTTGFCKLVVDRPSGRILGCHIVGERAVDIVQVAALAMSCGMRVDELARFPISFPIYAAILGRAAAVVAHDLNRDVAGVTADDPLQVDA